MCPEADLKIQPEESISTTINEALRFSSEKGSETNEELCTALAHRWVEDLGIGQPGGPENVILDMDTWGYELVGRRLEERVAEINKELPDDDKVKLHFIALQDCETVNEQLENLEPDSDDYQEKMDRLTGADILASIPEDESKIAIAIRGFGNDNIQVPDLHQAAYSQSRNRFKAESRKDGWRLHYFCTEENAQAASMPLAELMHYELKALIAADENLEIKAKFIAEIIGQANRITVRDNRPNIDDKYRMNLSIGVEDVEAYASCGNFINILGAEAFTGPKCIGTDTNGDPILDCNGTFATDTQFIYAGEKVTRLRFDIKDGKILLDTIDLEIANNDEEAQQKILKNLIADLTPTTLPAKVGENGTIIEPRAQRNMIGEFGIGLNPLIPINTGNRMLIEKMLGIHVGIGDAYPDFVREDGVIQRVSNNVYSDTHNDIVSANYDDHLDIIFEFSDGSTHNLRMLLMTFNP